MTEHTPGTWRFDDSVHGCNGGIIHIRAGEWPHPEICTLWASALIMKEDDNGLAENYANARLIAAAPELLAALKTAQFWLDVDGRYDMQGINAAIAKAEGRS